MYYVQPLIVSNPKIVAELILALCIQHKNKRDYGRDCGRTMRSYDLTDSLHYWYPPFYDKGPFLSLLTVSPENGLEVIIKLVNIATYCWLDCERWLQKYRPYLFKEESPLTIRVAHDEEHREWIGERRWLFAYRDSTTAPDILVCALMALEKWFYDRLDKNEPIEEFIDGILGSTDSLALVGILIAVAKRKPSLFMGYLKAFLGVPELYQFELHHFVESEHHQMMAWDRWQHSDNQIKQAKAWHNMKHRQIQLEGFAVSLMLTEPSLQSFFADVREAWQKRLANADENDPSKDIQSRLILQFDPAHWKASEDGNQWHFQPPEHFLTQAISAERELKDRQLLLWFPMHCRQILDGEESATDEILQQVRKQGEYLLSLDIEKLLGEEKFLRYTHDIACALAALAVCLPGKWLEDWSDWQTWCRQSLLEAVFNQPSLPYFDLPESVNNSAWDRYCANALPILWAASPNDSILRQAIAVLCLNRHYETIYYLFSSTAKQRDKLGDDFLRLEHLVIRWSVIRHRMLVLGGTVWGIEKATHKQLNKEVHKLINQFVSGKLSPKIPNLRRLKHTFVIPAPSLIEKIVTYVRRKFTPQMSLEERLASPFITGNQIEVHPHNYWKRAFPPRSPGLDLILIQRAFDWLPALSEAKTPQERVHWIDFWRQCVDTLQWVLGEGNPDIDDIEGTPYQFDRWLFKRLPNVLLHLNEPEIERTLWEPILRLGRPGHYWVENFLQEWFLVGTRATQQHESFLRIWRDMVVYAETHPNWDMWCSMMGWELTAIQFIWNEESAQSLVELMLPDYERWARQHLHGFQNIECFCHFLETPAADSIRGQGIQWLADSLPPDGFCDDSSQSIENSLVRLLEQYYAQQGHLHKLDVKLRDSFLRILRTLVERQNKRAMALQEAILTVSGS